MGLCILFCCLFLLHGCYDDCFVDVVGRCWICWVVLFIVVLGLLICGVKVGVFLGGFGVGFVWFLRFICFGLWDCF